MVFFVGVDFKAPLRLSPRGNRRTSKFIFVELVERADMRAAAAFKRHKTLGGPTVCEFICKCW
jgi:hypothetical protein